MKEIELPSGKYLLVEWSKIRKARKIIDDHSIEYEVFPFRAIYWLGIPIGKWSIIGIADELTFSDKVSIIEHENDGSGNLRSHWYRNYEDVDTDRWLKSPDESFKTLIASHSMKPETTLILRSIPQ